MTRVRVIVVVDVLWRKDGEMYCYNNTSKDKLTKNGR